MKAKGKVTRGERPHAIIRIRQENGKLYASTEFPAQGKPEASIPSLQGIALHDGDQIQLDLL